MFIYIIYLFIPEMHVILRGPEVASEKRYCLCCMIKTLVKFLQGESSLKVDLIKSINHEWEALVKMACISRVYRTMGDEAPICSAIQSKPVLLIGLRVSKACEKMKMQQRWNIFGNFPECCHVRGRTDRTKRSNRSNASGHRRISCKTINYRCRTKRNDWRWITERN